MLLPCARVSTLTRAKSSCRKPSLHKLDHAFVRMAARHVQLQRPCLEVLGCDLLRVLNQEVCICQLLEHPCADNYMSCRVIFVDPVWPMAFSQRTASWKPSAFNSTWS